MDQRSGLAYMQQRYYDPGIGRFLSVDPMASDTTTGWNFNRYNYAANNPYKFTDPDGRVIGSPQTLIRKLNEGAHEVSEAVKETMGDVIDVATAIYDRTDIRVEVDLAMGGGISVSQSLLHGDGKIEVTPVAISGKIAGGGQGAYAGILLQPRTGLVVSEGMATPVPMSASATAKVGGGLSAGIEGEVRANGRIEITPKGGIGVGEVTLFGPRIELGKWSGWSDK